MKSFQSALVFPSALLTVVLLLSASVATGKSVRQDCPPKPPTVPDFDVVRVRSPKHQFLVLKIICLTLSSFQYLGDWYQQTATPMNNQPAYSTCTKAEYRNLGEGVVSVHNTEVTPEGEFEEICGNAYQPDPINAPGELTVGFPSGKTKLSL